VLVAHIVSVLDDGGVSRALMGIARSSAEAGRFRHVIVPLRPPTPKGRAMAAAADIDLVPIEAADAVLTGADVIQINHYNHPALNALVRGGLPAARLVGWFLIAGDTPPHVITDDWLAYVDAAVATSPYTRRLELPGAEAMDLVYATTQRSELTGLECGGRGVAPRVSYIGTVNFAKMHPEYVRMHADVAEDASFTVCGVGPFDGETRRTLETQAAALGIAERLEFLPWTDKVGDVLAATDVFGYPLHPQTYATSEMVVQEAMLAGLPVVVLARGAARDLIDNGRTGILVDSPQAYSAAVTDLLRSRRMRRELGANARAHARGLFDVNLAARAMEDVYDRVLQDPKRHRRWRHGRERTGAVWPVAGGAEIFIDALGRFGEPFLESLSLDRDVAERGERGVLEHGRQPIALSPGNGSVRHYSRFYPENGLLHYWNGLVSLGAGDRSGARRAFHEARRCGHRGTRFERWARFVEG
jgi:glycosyltransferase involved in cell wall biosynthesis